MKANFPYEDCNKADMYLTFDASIGKKKFDLPAVKVAEGIIATSELYKKTLVSANPALATDSYQRINKKKQEANIQFLIQQATIRKSELKNNSVQEFVRLLSEINNDQEKLALDNVEISAFASPDGGYSLNDKLAGQRQKVTEDYVNKGPPFCTKLNRWKPVRFRRFFLYTFRSKKLPLRRFLTKSHSAFSQLIWGSW